MTRACGIGTGTGWRRITHSCWTVWIAALVISALVLLAGCSTDEVADGPSQPPSESASADTTAPTTEPALSPTTAAPAATDAPTTETPSSEPPSTDAPSTQPPTTDQTVPGPPASTVDDLLALGRPVILSHAGGEDTAPHSTPFAFAESVRAGVDVLDFDVRLTADGVVVVQHDETTGRTADEDLDVYSSTYEELHALDNAHWFTDDCTCTDQPDEAYTLRGIRTGDTPPPAGYTPEDFAIAAFGDLIDLYPDWVLNIEIKARDAEGIATADALAALLTEKDALDRSIVTSFDDKVVRHFHRLAPTVTMTPGLQMSTDVVLSGVAPPEWAPIMQVPPTYDGLEVFTPEYVQATHDMGLVTWVWPNGEGEDVEGYLRLLEMGADGVNASDPAAGVEALQQYLDGP